MVMDQSVLFLLVLMRLYGIIVSEILSKAFPSGESEDTLLGFAMALGEEVGVGGEEKGKMSRGGGEKRGAKR